MSAAAHRAPWWRILRACITGTFARMAGAKTCREWELRRRHLGYSKHYKTIRQGTWDPNPVGPRWKRSPLAPRP